LFVLHGEILTVALREVKEELKLAELKVQIEECSYSSMLLDEFELAKQIKFDFYHQ